MPARLLLAVAVALATSAALSAQTIYTVTTTADAGPGSLRQAILDANANAGADVIAFAIPGAGPHTIQPQSALPTVTDPVEIDGYTEPGAVQNSDANGFNGTLLIEIDGTNAGVGASGLRISAGSSTVRGLVINRFVRDTSVSGNEGGGNGIWLEANGGNVIEGNFIGTDVAGTADAGNANYGVFVDDVAGNRIGGTASAARNVISANNGIEGIRIFGSTASGNTIQGNFVGTDKTGTAALPNRDGIGILEAPNNTIGGTASGAGNVISGNSSDGVDLFAASNTTVEGNLIGTDATGTQDLGNGLRGVIVNLSASAGTTVGGTTAAARNVISGNGFDGLNLTGGATGVTVTGNYIGTDATGANSLGNDRFGVLVSSGANGNTIGGVDRDAGVCNRACNLISANGNFNVEIISSTLPGNLLQGNFIGTDLSGTAALSNGSAGVFLAGTGNAVGGTAGTAPGGPCAGACNLVSGNATEGIILSGSGSSDNVVQGNYIGTDVTGLIALGNTLFGLNIIDAKSTQVGGTTAAARNLISANGGAGIALQGSATGTTVEGNYIGLGTDGATALGNVAFFGPTGGGDGWGIFVGASNNTIGGTAEGAGNVSSSNAGDGIILTNGATGTTVQGNLIGTDATGLLPLGNNFSGIAVFSGQHTIGGDTAGARNVIADNGIFGITIDGPSDNVVQGNYIGLGTDGSMALGNRGTTISGTGHGVFVKNASGTQILGNTISSNANDGVLLNETSLSNVVQGNFIGTDATGTLDRGNARDGVDAGDDADNNTIGGTGADEGNVVAFNADEGVEVGGVGNAVLGNSVFGNGGLGIDLRDSADTAGPTANDAGDPDEGPNRLQNTPVIATVTGDGTALTVDFSVDTAPGNATYPLTVEFFLADADGEEGQTFLGSVSYTSGQAQTAAQAQFQPAAEVPDGAQVVATATDADGNTSEFSAAATVSGGAIPVELVRFEAVLDGAAALLTWETASETVNAGFEVQRRAIDPPGAPADTAWAVLDFVESAAPSGTTSEAQAYRYADTALPPGVSTLRYRLRQVDFDGAFAYSPEVEVALGLPAAFALEAVYPNPVRGEATVAYALPTESDVRLAIYDVLGRRAALLHDGPHAAGRHTAALATAQLAAGVYVVRFEAGAAAVTRRVTVLR